MNGIGKKLKLLAWCQILGLVAFWGGLVAEEAAFSPQNDCVVSCGSGVAGLLPGASSDRRLESVDLLMADAPAPGGGFRVSLHRSTAEGRPGVKVADLLGSENPENAGKYSYRADESVLLAANEAFWVVAKVESAGACYGLQSLTESNMGTDDSGFLAEFHVLGDGKSPMSRTPAVFLHLLPATEAVQVVYSSQHKTIWTLLLSGVIVLCCFDLFPRPGFLQ